jgi:UDP-N-acetylglucosamine:LPS N-acetylglucosamine transferase
MRKVLILTAGYGEGHNTAARGLKEAFDVLGTAEAKVLDLCDSALGTLYQRSRRGYLRMVHERPWLWEFLYAALHRFPSLLGNAHRLIWPLSEALVRELKQLRPAAVVSVYPVYGYLVSAAARKAGLPGLKHFVLITDSISVNALWYRCDADAFLTPNEDTATVLKAAGVEPEKIEVTGFPVSPRFVQNTTQRTALKNGTQPRVLLMVNGGPSRIIPLVERLLRELDIALTVTVGKDDRLGTELNALAVRMGKPLEVLGWVEDLPTLLQRHHVLIGKAGGATVQEALAAHTPMLITHILPGQETGNARLLLQNGCGAHVPTSEAILLVLTKLFQHDAEAWHRMYRNCVSLGRPDAALVNARWILQQTDASTPSRGTNGLRPDKADNAGAKP